MPPRQLLSKFWLKNKKLIFLPAQAGLFFILIFLGFFFIIQIFFSISLIEISGISDLKGLNTLKNKLIFLVSTKKTEQKLYFLNPNVKSIKIIKIYPNKIKINVEKDDVTAILEVFNGYFYLSSEGRIIEKRKDKNSAFPLMYYYQKLQFNEYDTGETLKDKDIKYSLFFAKAFSFDEIKIDTIDINGLDMLILKKGEKTYFFTTTKDKEIQYNELKTIIEKFRKGNVKYKSIDLRFNKPIVKLDKS